MGRLVMWNLVTVDGYFEGATSWDLEWHGLVLGDEFESYSLMQLEAADALVFGRATYVGMANYWRTETGRVAELMNGIRKFVFSATLEDATWNNTRLVRGDAVREMGDIKRGLARDAFVFGSAELCASLTDAGLIDEYRLCLVPVLLGQGKPLFKPSRPRKNLRLIRTERLASGGIILCYEPA